MSVVAPIVARFSCEKLASGNWLGTLTAGDITVEREDRWLLPMYGLLLNSWWKESQGRESGDRIDGQD